MARWLKARCAAAVFSALPDHVFCGAACKARPYEKVTRHGSSPSLLIASRCAVASSSDCPPDKNAMPGTAAGTQSLSMRTVFSATSAIDARQRVRIGLHAGVARHHMCRPDIDDRAPLGEFGAEPAIFDEPLAQAVKSLGNDF